MLYFRWSKKAEITLETISFWQNISISIYTFSAFLVIIFYWLFKIHKRFSKEREKTLMQKSMRKEKLRKFELFQNDLQRNFCFLVSGISKGEMGTENS